MKKYFTAICFLLLTGHLSAQTYRSYQGTMLLMMTYRDSIIIAKNDCIQATIDYETCKLNVKVPYGSFYTGINTIDSVFSRLNEKSFEYKGVLGISYINTKKHQQEEFKVDGDIMGLKPFNTIAKGTLTYVPAGLYSCVLTLQMQSALSVLNIEEYFHDVKDTVQIYIQQAVLKRMDE